MITVLKFSADWCGPCNALQPTWEKLQEEVPDAIFQSINIDDNPQQRADYFVRTIPTLVAVKDGKEVGRRAGGPLGELKGWIDECRRV